MKKPAAFYSIILVYLCLFGCTPSEEGPSSQKQLLEFKFTQSLNNIDVDSKARFNGVDVNLFLPVGSNLQDLVPEFSVSDKAEVKIDGRTAFSGETEFDFTNELEMIVVAEDASEQIYYISVVTNIKSLNNAIEDFMSTYNIPGIQLAITKDEKLVYTKSFGYSDLENEILVDNESIFRVASISKTITALAILKLEEKGLLNLDDKVFGNEGILGEYYGTPPYENDKLLITIRHLLEHTSGWTNSPYDPMFTEVNISKEELIDDMLDNRPLDFSPGTNSYYLNFGYCLLGRIIEKVTGAGYEEYVKNDILTPSGISDMKIGKNSLEERYSNEVKYYDQEGYSPYFLDIPRMDAAGGWLSSSTSLLRLLVRVDRNNAKADILNSTSLNKLYFGFENWYFFGSLSGTSSALSRVDDDFGYAIIANTRTIPIDDMLNQMNVLMRNEINNRQIWPSYDLFTIN